MKKILKNNQIIITALAIMIVIVWYLNYTDSDIRVKSDNNEKVASVDGADAYTDVSSTLTENDVDLDSLLKEENSKFYVTDEMGTENEQEFADISEEDVMVDEVQGKDAETTEVAAEEGKTEETAANETASVETGAEDAVEADGSSEHIAVSDTGELYSQENSESSTPGEAVLASTTIDSSYFASAKLTREQNRAKEKETLLNMIEDVSLSEEVKQEAIDSILALNKVMEKENSTELLLEAKGFDGAVVSIVDSSVEVVVNAPTITEQQVAQIESIVKRKTGASSENIVISPVVVEE